MDIKIGSIVRYKSAKNKGFIGIVKGWKDWGIPIEAEPYIILDVIWLLDPSIYLKPRLDEVELIA